MAGAFFQTLSCALGVWVTAAPSVLGYTGLAATNDRVVGPIVASLACIAAWEVTRALRWINVVLGLWLIAAPIALRYPAEITSYSIINGILIALLSLPGRPDPSRYGGGWLALIQKGQARR